MSHCAAPNGGVKAYMLAIMRSLVVALCMLVSPAFAEPPSLPLAWVKLTEIYYTTGQVRMYGDTPEVCSVAPCNAVYVQTRLGEGGDAGPQATDTWHTVDLTAFGVAEDAKVAFLSGVLIITHGTTEELANLTVTLRAHGDNNSSCSKYLGQVIETSIASGQRSTFSTMVPLNAGKFDFCYRISTTGNYPDHSAYAINLSLQAWGR